MIPESFAAAIVIMTVLVGQIADVITGSMFTDSNTVMDMVNPD